MSETPNAETMLHNYRQLYPFLREDELQDVMERNERFLSLALRQIERLKRERRWPI